MTPTFKAVQVILLTPHIREYLEQNDPQALKQLQDAVEEETPVYEDTINGFPVYINKENKVKDSGYPLDVHDERNNNKE